MARIALGIEVFEEEWAPRLRGRRLGLLSNQASLDRHLRPAKQVIAGLLPGQMKALFGPQHGHGGEDQDNMVETAHSHDEDLKIPVFSLYSHTREPLPEMLDLVDVLLIDLQDVGTRVYTFATTVLHCLKAAAAAGKTVIVLDRPNPLGGEILEGGILREEFYSFVGPFTFPMRHGLSMAEMARIFNTVLSIGCDLKIAPIRGWERSMLWHDTGRRWVMPSPNMPVFETAQVYPGQVIWEGTNLSEGRGTCRPFEIFGAPFLDLKAVKAQLPPEASRGCHLQEITFRPTFHKWAGEICRGFMIHVTDPPEFRPCFSTVALMTAVMKIHGDRFAWRQPPYEYEFDRMPIDLILGDRSLREDLERGVEIDRIKDRWDEELKTFGRWRDAFLIYR
ncbi:MAG: DUF1343 domain-containing protein [Deltaproteobacteria bacterium]|nr:DUF1343 domain-containing protein [Deltaproteobacteria bacterium]